MVPNGIAGNSMACLEDPRPNATLILVRTVHPERVLVNRGEHTPYWDNDPGLPRGANDLRFIQYFDFDERGWRDFYYAEVLVAACEGASGVVGRVALVPWDAIERFSVDPYSRSESSPLHSE